MDEAWAAKVLEEEMADKPLQGVAPGTLYHATKGIVQIERDKAIRPLADIRRDVENAAAGFGHAGYVSGANHVSLTTSEDRARAYFDVLVALAAIAEQKVPVAQWFEWYLARWGSPDDLLQETTVPCDSGLPSALADAFALLQVQTAWGAPADMRRDALAALAGLDVTARLAWLFAMDEALMQVESADLGLGVVRADAGAWSSIRVADVALLRVQLPHAAVGYLHADEEEVRVRAVLTDFEVLERGETRLATFRW